MNVHLQGMGWLGSYLAWRLEAAGIPFTWEDIDAPITAWRASTGGIYPSGHALDMSNYHSWANARLHASVADCLSPANYWYTSQHAPHGGRWPAIADHGFIRLHALPSYHVNVQRFVHRTRAHFAALRTSTQPPNCRLVVAHGYSPRLQKYMWGWSRKVRLLYDQERFGPNASFYIRQRYFMAYAYPVPGEDCWYAGSSLITQRTARELEVEPKWARWLHSFQELMHGAVAVWPLAESVQGWRPRGADNDEWWVTQDRSGTCYLRPLWHSGVRWAPAVADALIAALR